MDNRTEFNVSPAYIALLLTLIISLHPFKFFFYVALFTIVYVTLILTQAKVNLSLVNMEPKAAELLAILKNPNVSVDNKVAHVTSIKSDIKQKNVPEGAVAPIFESLRLAITSQHASLLGAGFSTLGHLMKRLFIQDQAQLVASQIRSLYPQLLERLGDHKERVRQQAAQAFTDLWQAAREEAEHCVLGVALVGKNPRAKETSLIWLANMTKNHGLLFRAYVPSLVACLEDADSGVRDTAKNTVIELFQNAQPRAKADLQKQLVAHNVRKSIANVILANIGLASGEQEIVPATRPVSRAETLHKRPVSVMSMHSSYHSDVPKEESDTSKNRPGTSKSERSRPAALSHSDSTGSLVAPVPTDMAQVGEKIEPLLISSARDIDEMVREMMPHFEGRESENNWTFREKHIATLRRLTRGNAPLTFSNQYLGAIKTLLDGIFKAVNSLRTTLSSTGCLLIQDIAKTCGPKLDPMVEIFLQNLIKLCSGMKKISAQNGNDSVDAVIDNVTYTPRILQHVCGSSMDKNVQLRLYATGWMKTLIKKQAHHRASMEHGGGLDLMDKAIKKGLSDANPGVREAMRSTFWTFFNVWPDRANDMMSSLDSKSRSLLEKDPANPNAQQSSLKESTTSRSTLSKSTSANSALKEAIAARKKAHLKPVDTLPARPESAQSTFSEVKKAGPSTKSSAVRTVPTGSKTSTMSSAPMRPAIKPRRPELARPATADPYASHKLSTSDTMAKATNAMGSSPKMAKAIQSINTPLSKLGSASRPRPKTDHALASTTKSKPKKLDISKIQSLETKSAAQRSRSQSLESTVPTSSEAASYGESVTTCDVPREEGHHTESLKTLDGIQPPAVSAPLESPGKCVLQQQGHACDELVGNVVHIAPQESGSLVDEKHPAGDAVHESNEESLDLVATIANTNVDSERETKPESVKIYEDPIASGPVSSEGNNNVVHEEMRIISSVSTATSTGASNMSFIPLSALGPAYAFLKTTHQPHQPAASHSGREPEAEVSIADRHDGVSSLADRTGSPDFPDDEYPVINPKHPHAIHPSRFMQPANALLNQNNNENKTPFENKFASFPAINRPASKSNALEEVPTNQPLHRDQKKSVEQTIEDLPAGTETSHRRWKKVESSERRRSISPRSKDPVKAREMLDKGIQRIRSKTMDILGYRKLQGLIVYHDSIFTDEGKYDEMLMALLDELESQPDEKRQRLGRPLDLKTQVLLTVRYMFRHNKQYFSAYYPKAITAIINARKRYDSSCHVVSGLDETAEDIVAVCKPGHVMDAVLDVIETEEKTVEGYRCITMGISVLSKLLCRFNSKGTSLKGPALERVGRFAGRTLHDSQPDVRKQIVQLCVLLHANLKGDDTAFWSALGSPKEGHRNLLTYYINRK